MEKFNEQVSAYLESLTHFHAVPDTRVSVCRVCCGPTGTNHEDLHYARCARCADTAKSAKSANVQVANATSFITYALQYENKTSDMALTDMYDYKNPRRPERIRNDASVRIASLLYSALHSPEKRQQIGGPLTVVTFVPSSDDAGFSALSQVVERALRKIKHSPPVTSTLAWTPNRERVKRKFDAEKYTVLDPDWPAAVISDGGPS